MKSRLGHYEIIAELGRGGMGVVYKALDPALGRMVAIKELAPTLADDPALVERFLREARSMASLNDPHIVNIHFIGQENGRPFFVMELVDGEALASILRRLGRLEAADALKITHQTALGLATAHERGVVHRDIKPGNLLIDTRGRVRIADFGIALPTRDPSQKLTSTGEFIGTPGYVSPEICKGEAVEAPSDIFSLGVVLFEMLSGRMPFTDVSPLGLMLEVVNAEIPDIQTLNADTDAGASEILGRMVAKNPADRYQNGSELAAALASHPLVAGRGPVGVVVQPPKDSDTIVAALSQPRVPTPPPMLASAVADGSSTAPRSPPLRPRATPAGNDAEATVARAQPVAAPGRGYRRLAAALALVTVMGGTAYAFRDYLSGFGNGFRDGFVVGKISNPVATSQADTPAGAAELAAGNGAAAAQDSTDGSAATGTAATASTSTATSAAAAAQNPDVGVTDPSASADPTASATTTASGAVPADAAATNGSAAVASSNDSAATEPRAAVPSQTRIAAPPPPPPARVAVVTLGDAAIGLPAQQRIEDYLAGAGHRLADSDLIGGGDLASLLRSARRHARVLVVVRADPVGARELQYYGRRDVAYTAQLGVRAYDTQTGQPLGAGFRRQVEFAALNAEVRAHASVDGDLPQLERQLAPVLRRRDRG